MAMLKMRMLKAKRNMAIMSITVFWAKPISDRHMPCTRKPITIGIRLSNRVMSQPDMGRPNKELIGMVSRIEPNSASLKPKLVLMVGIRDAQLAKQNPERKKNRLKKKRCLFLMFISHIKRVQISALVRIFQTALGWVNIKVEVQSLEKRERKINNFKKDQSRFFTPLIAFSCHGSSGHACLGYRLFSSFLTS